MGESKWQARDRKLRRRRSSMDSHYQKWWHALDQLIKHRSLASKTTGSTDVGAGRTTTTRDTNDE
jgi:hypothetical protein